MCLRGLSSPFKKRLMLLDSEYSGGQTTWAAIDSLFKRSNISCLLSHILILTQRGYPRDRIPYLAGYIGTTRHAFGWGCESPCVNCDWNNDSVFRFLWCQLESTLVRITRDLLNTSVWLMHWADWQGLSLKTQLRSLYSSCRKRKQLVFEGYYALSHFIDHTWNASCN